MNPKCPWCGGKVIARKNTTNWWVHECEENCYSSCLYATEEKALAAASKRFMPKRSVEEIYEFARIIAKQARPESAKYPQAIKFFTVQMFHRIADYIYGVTE